MDIDIPPQDLKRCSEFWYTDGTVVLQAERTLFRVYTGILAQYSPIFRDLFAVPQPAVQEQYDGCPIVCLSDTASDLYSFLKVIHDVSFDIADVADVTVVGGILRIATKYEVQQVRTRAIDAIRRAYPTDLSSYLECAPHFTPRVCPARRMYVVNLARETNALVLLPTALLFCCSSEFSDLFRGMELNGEHVELSTQDKELVMFGRHRLSQRARRSSHRCMFPSLIEPFISHIDLCEDHERCHRASLEYLHEYNVNGWIDPFLPPVWRDSSGPTASCEACRTRTLDTYEKTKSTVWDKLPSAFNLPKWADLEKTTKLEDEVLCAVQRN